MLVDECGEVVDEFDGCPCKLKRTPIPRVTICGIYDDETNLLNFGVSRCSSLDTFVKKTGRELAYKRAETTPVCTVTLRPGERMSNVFYSMVHDLAERYL